MTLEPGIRVVRGPDWKWAEQDGGLGHLGTIVPFETTNPNKPSVEVRWDRGLRGDYRIGYQNAYDLRLFDNSTVGVNHSDVRCDVCQKSPIFGIRWRCLNINNYNLCSSCYHGGKANIRHQFYRIVVPGSKGVLMEKRSVSHPIEVKGLFPGAKVRVGSDLKVDKKDERIRFQGTLQRLEPWEQGYPNTGAIVSWPPFGQSTYRVGYKGMMDLKTKDPRPGGLCYLAHLPVLGHPVEMERVEGLIVGDHVIINMEETLLRELQEGHGDWVQEMADAIGKVGIIHGITSNQDLMVEYPEICRKWIFHPAALTKVTRRLSSVVEVDESGDYRIEVDKTGSHHDAQAVHPRQSRTSASLASPMSTDQRGNVRIHEVSMRIGLEKSEDMSKVVAIAAAQGDEENVREILKAHPEWVNSPCDEKSPLQLAVHGGFMDVAKLLIAAGADLNMTDEDGDTALMFPIYGNHPKIVQFLLSKGADINAVNNERRSALHQAVTRSYLECMKVLLACHCNVNIQDNFGDTALHDAINGQSKPVLSLLLETGGIDFRLSNKRQFNALQWAAMKGNQYAVQRILAIDPQLASIRNVDGQTALHIAARNNFEDIVRILIVKGECNVNEYTVDHQTPLLLAVRAGHIEVVEVLLKLWADVNMPDADGDTSLHVALLRQVIFQDVTETIILQKIRSRIPDQSVATSGLALACLLVEYKGDLYHVNNKGQTPLDIVPDEKVHAVLRCFVPDGGRTSPGESRKESLPSNSPNETEQERAQREKIAYYEDQFKAPDGRDNRYAETGAVADGGRANQDASNAASNLKELESKMGDGGAGRRQHLQMQQKKERQCNLAPFWSLSVSDDVAKVTVGPSHRHGDDDGNQTPVHISKQQMEESCHQAAFQDKPITDHTTVSAAHHDEDNRDQTPEHIIKQQMEENLHEADHQDPEDSRNHNSGQNQDHIDMQARKESGFNPTRLAPSPLHRPVPPLDLTPQQQYTPVYEPTPSPISFLSTTTPTTLPPNLARCQLGCGAIADAQYKPCGHISVCHRCSECFMLCNVCRKPIETILQMSRAFPALSNTDPDMGQQTPRSAEIAASGATGDATGRPPGARRKIFECDSDLTKSILIQKNQKLEEELLCPICIDKKRELVFMCGHSMCEECTSTVDECPFCRRSILKMIRMY